MTRHHVSKVAQENDLIVALGESWLRRNIDNKFRRKYYASERMRLVARLLIYSEKYGQAHQCRPQETGADKEPDGVQSHEMQPQDSQGNWAHQVAEPDRNQAPCETEPEPDGDQAAREQGQRPEEEPEPDGDQAAREQGQRPEEDQVGAAECGQGLVEMSMWDFIDPAHFDDVVEAAIMCAYQYMDDMEDLKASSNAIKLKYDIKRLVNSKWSFCWKTGRGKTIDAEGCTAFIAMMNIEWGEKVTKLARSVLITRTFQADLQVPAPQDLEKLTKHICMEINNLDLSRKDSSTFRQCVILAQTRLLSYNKRRSGEIGAAT